jgi:endopeptidase E
VPAIKPDISSNIIGGKAAVPYSWPWQISMTRKRNETYRSHTCGGSVISKQWILSAAHCVYDDRNLDTYRIKLGVNNQNKDDEQGEKVLKISEIHVHPKFDTDDPAGGYDISLLKLAEPIEFTDHISPVCLPTKQDEALPQVDAAVLTGWGRDKAGGRNDPIPLPDLLQQVSLPLLSKQRCNSLVGTNDGRLVCLGGVVGKSVCFGDSGGPAVVQENGQWKQIGTASFVTNGQCRGYSVYSAVSPGVDFIRQYVKDL